LTASGRSPGQRDRSAGARAALGLWCGVGLGTAARAVALGSAGGLHRRRDCRRLAAPIPMAAVTCSMLRRRRDCR
jgi:hypothetical protein